MFGTTLPGGRSGARRVLLTAGLVAGLLAGCDDDRAPDERPGRGQDAGVPDGGGPADLGPEDATARDLQPADEGVPDPDLGDLPPGDSGPPADSGDDAGGPEDSGADGGQTVTWPDERCAPGAGLPPWVEAGTEEGTGQPRFTASSGGVTLQITVAEAGVLRLRYAPASGWQRPSWAVLPAASRPGGAGEVVPVAGATLDGGERFLLCTPLLALELSAQRCLLTVRDAQGTVLLEDPAEGGYFEGRASLHGSERTTVGVVRKVEAAEHFYGFGEKTRPFDKRGRTLVFWNTDAFNSQWHGYLPDTDPLYQSVPFHVGLRGSTAYGLFTDNTHYLTADVAATRAERFTLTAYGGAVDQYLIAGPAAQDVLRRYTWLTGRMPLPPRWVLGYHQSRWQDTELDAWLRDTCRQLRQRRLPADGIWLDINHMDGFRTFTWDPERFPDPEGLLAELAGLGFKSTIIVDPGIKEDSNWAIFREGLEQGHFLRNPDGTVFIGEVWAGRSAFPDFSSPEARSWWAGLVAGAVRRGVRGIWIDMNEPTSFVVTSAGTTPPDEVQGDGDGQQVTMAELHNAYALLEAQATYEGMLQGAPGRRPFLLTRAGYAGEQRYTAVWTGDAPSDWSILDQTPAMLLGLGLSGVPFTGSDVGGYSGRADGEMFARWMQVGSLSPFFRGHTERDGQHQEPWVFGEEVEQVSRQAMEQRSRLLPYWYSLLHEAMTSGAPPLRPLVWEFPEDEATHTLGDEVLLGPWLLYAPVMKRDTRATGEGEPNHSVYLPAGRWFELHSGAVWDGPTRVELRVTLAELPVFVREGAILPSTVATQYTDERPVDPLILDLYPTRGDSPTSFALYEDDGDSLSYQEGQFSRVVYTLTGDREGALLRAGDREGRWQPPARGLRVRVHRVDQPPAAAGAVLLDGRPLEAAASLEELEQPGAEGWWYDPDDRSLVAVFADRPSFSLRFQYDPALTELQPSVRVTLQVEVPASTPRDRAIHVATSADWGRHVPLEWVGEHSARGTVEVPRGRSFFYKYTRGSWETVEKQGDCSETINRYAFGAAHPIEEDRVVRWRDDGCP